MKFGLVFANVGPFGQPEGLTHLARTAEAVGIESLWTVEHVVVPKGYQSKYPYDPGGKMPGPESAPIPDPLIWLSYAAAVTTRIKLATGILILPQRHPFYVAKEVASLDVLSGGRAMLGIGVGWLEEEFKALGVPFESRAAITDEAVAALRDLWGAGASEFKGDHFEWPAVESNPKPVNGHVPIVIGGHTKAAARRAARLGDGFFPVSANNLEECLVELEAACARRGRDMSEIEITTGSVPTLDEVRRLEDLGVSRFVTGPPGFTPDALEAGLEKLGNELISRF
ncbi:MAG: LLM class F420-dependent oxidoreductase [Deltaproteobacteria bacterium]|jgi:probable F420-dependent oxidoreductase|nr:LLM class F420-dependent oxidoreductase [Deltaproteobacteria bacterium]MBW2496724.1 LLM class F420-dependent oxidoreductase [Deltaproteobacteria bacterium]